MQKYVAVLCVESLVPRNPIRQNKVGKPCAIDTIYVIVKQPWQQSNEWNILLGCTLHDRFLRLGKRERYWRKPVQMFAAWWLKILPCILAWSTNPLIQCSVRRTVFHENNQKQMVDRYAVHHVVYKDFQPHHKFLQSPKFGCDQ